MMQREAKNAAEGGKTGSHDIHGDLAEHRPVAGRPDMRVFYGFDALPHFVRPTVTVGSYDGVHSGHLALLRTVAGRARAQGGESVVLTFEPHPRVTLGRADGLRLLTSLEEKIYLLGQQGIDNLIVMRTAFVSVPAALEESAMIDGANDFTILFKIILPLSKATLAVVVLFYVVEHWNSWFSASIYLRDRERFPLQLFLREILISSSSSTAAGEASSVDGVMYLEELIKYCSIVISTLPILCVYPFVQKYFISGVMLGSVKE